MFPITLPEPFVSEFISTCIPLSYIGTVDRYTNTPTTNATNTDAANQYHLLRNMYISDLKSTLESWLSFICCSSIFE